LLLRVGMKIWTNAIIAGGLLAAAVLGKKLVRSRRGAHATPTDEVGFSAGHHDLAFNAITELKKDLAVIAAEERDARAHQQIAEPR